MAFAGSPTSSPTYAKYAAHDFVESHVWGGKVRLWDSQNYAHIAGAGTGEINLIKMEPGKYILLPYLCRLITSQYAATAILDIGHRAYTKHDGTVVAEDDNAFADNLAVGGGALNQTLPLPAGMVFEIDSKTDFIIYATVATANIEDTDTLRLIVLASEGN